MSKILNPKKKSLGVLVHPTSLPGGSYCGTFGDSLKSWINLLSVNKIYTWQFLPLTPTDSLGSPYSSPSSFALNPWLLDANELKVSNYIKDSELLEKIREEGQKTRTVVVEWESIEAANAGYNSDGYQEALKKLDGSAVREFRYVEMV